MAQISDIPRNAIHQIFGRPKALIGMIHCPPLPGAPRYRGTPRDDILSACLRDAERLVAGGMHGLLVENHGDIPFSKPEDIGPETAAFLAVIAARIARAAVVFGAHGLGVDDRALLAQLIHEDVVAGGKVDVIGRIGSAHGAHVLAVERVLEREGDAIERHRLEIGVGAIGRVQFRRLFQRIGMAAEDLADRGRALGQRAIVRMAVIVAAADNGAFAPDVQRRKRVDLGAVRYADDHAVLLHDTRVRHRRLHPAQLQRRALVGVEVGIDVGDGDGLGRELQRRPGPDGALSRRDGGAVPGHETAGRAVDRPGAGDVMLHDLDAGHLTCGNRGVHLGDGRLLQSKAGVGGDGVWCHGVSPRWAGHGPLSCIIYF